MPDGDAMVVGAGHYSMPLRATWQVAMYNEYKCSLFSSFRVQIRVLFAFVLDGRGNSRMKTILPCVRQSVHTRNSFSCPILCSPPLQRVNVSHLFFHVGDAFHKVTPYSLITIEPRSLVARHDLEKEWQPSSLLYPF